MSGTITLKKKEFLSISKGIIKIVENTQSCPTIQNPCCNSSLCGWDHKLRTPLNSIEQSLRQSHIYKKSTVKKKKKKRSGLKKSEYKLF